MFQYGQASRKKSEVVVFCVKELILFVERLKSGKTRKEKGMKPIDLRSDTVTRPSAGMRRAMAEARVGDDVFGEDPTVRALEERMADRLGKEAGLFVASGTMGNLVAILTHAGRGDEMLLGDLSHTFIYEGGGPAALGGVHPHPLPNLPDGTLDIDRLRRAIRNPTDIHQPPTRLICLENTHNRCGGVVLTPSYTEAVAELAHDAGARLHLDGARLFNASVATGIPAASLARRADSVMVCLSKGLGCPVGSILCGDRRFIERARRIRKLVGGGMRQAGIIAAAGIYALKNNIERLADDHRNAIRLASGIDDIPGLSSPQAGKPPTAWTNLVYFRIDPDAGRSRPLTAAILVERLRRRGVLAISLGGKGDQIRMVTHLDIRESDIDAALDALRSAVEET